MSGNDQGPVPLILGMEHEGDLSAELGWVPTWTTRAGKPRPWPVILGHEFSGEIAALGAGVKDMGVGDLVYGLNDWYRDGAYAEYCVARVADLAHKPAGPFQRRVATATMSEKRLDRSFKTS